jgi:hypothetical protein
VDLDALLALMDRRRGQLQQKARRLGARLYEPKPRRFRARIGSTGAFGTRPAVPTLEPQPVRNQLLLGYLARFISSRTSGALRARLNT